MRNQYNNQSQRNHQHRSYNNNQQTNQPSNQPNLLQPHILTHESLAESFGLIQALEHGDTHIHGNILHVVGIQTKYAYGDIAKQVFRFCVTKCVVLRRCTKSI